MANLEKPKSTESIPEESQEKLPAWRLDIEVLRLAKEIEEKREMLGSMSMGKNDVDLQKKLIRDLRKKLVEIVGKYTDDPVET